MTKFAAYHDASIYAVGDTPETAIAKAIKDTREPEARFLTAPISDALAAQIDQDGWNGHRQAFELDRNGQIVETENSTED